MRKLELSVAALMSAMIVAPAMAGTSAEAFSQTVDLTIKKDAETAKVEVTLNKGTYAFFAEGVDLTVTKGKDVQTPNAVTVVENGTKYTVEVKGAKAEKDQKVSVTISLDSGDWSPFKAGYTQKLAILINKAGNDQYKEDETLQNLASQASSLQVEINAFGMTEYDEWITTGKLSAFDAKLDQLSKDINAAVDNLECYNYAVAQYPTLDAELIELTAIYEAAAKETKDASKTLYEGLKEQVENFKKDAEAAYAGGTAATTFSKKNTDDKVEAIVKAIKAAIDAIENGSNNAISYANVVAKIAAVRNAYNDQAKKLYDLLAGAEDGDVYSDTYVEALTKLNASLRQLNTIEQENKDLYDAGDANETSQADFEDKLQKLVSDMEGVYAEYETYANTLRANYAAALADLADIDAYFKAKVTDVIGKRSTIADSYKSQIDAISDKIQSLKGDVESANKAHTIQGTDPFCDGYTANETAIRKAIDELSVKLDKAAKEYDANAATLATIGELQSRFNSEKDKVAKAQSTDKKYSTKDRFTATEKAVQDQIDALKSAANAAYKVDGNGTAQDYKSKLNTSKVESDITAYANLAEKALAEYNRVSDALVEINKDLDALKAAATDLDVTVDGEIGSQTYGAVITEAEDGVAAINAALEAAKGKSDKAHVDALSAIKIGVDHDAIEALTAAYGTNQTTWNANQLHAAKDRMLTESQRRVDAVVLPENYDFETYGKIYTELNADRQAIEDAVAAIQSNIETAMSAEDAAAIATLAEVIKDLEDVEAKVAALTKKADEAKAKYTAEKNANTALTKDINNLKAELAKVNYDNRTNFNDEKGVENAAITELSENVAASFVAETLVADRKSEADKGKGYDDTITKIKAQIANLLSLQKNEKDNDENNNKFNDNVTSAKVESAISKAESDINALKQDGNGEVVATPGKSYFLGVLHNSYVTEYESILTAQTTAYVAVTTSDLDGAKKGSKKYTDTSKNMTHEYNSLKARLDQVKSNISGLANLAKLNEESHGAQVKSAADAQALWNTVFAMVTNAETSNIHEATITKLTEIQQLIDALNVKIADDYKNGKCNSNKAATEAKIATINEELNKIQNNWSTDYTSAVAVDNTDRWIRFQQAYNTLTSTYSSEITLITKMSKLTYAAEVTDILLGITGDQGIYTYADKILQLWDDAKADKDETVAPDLFDAEENWKKQAEDYKSEIEALAKEYTDAVNAKAEATYVEEHDKVEAAKNNAVLAISSALGITTDEAKMAVADVQKLINDAEAVHDKQDFAYLLETEILPAFMNVESMLAADKEAKAVSVWNTMMDNYNDLAATEAAEIADFHDKDGNVGAYSNGYNGFVNRTLTKAANKWNEIADGQKFDNYRQIYAFLDEFLSDFRDGHTWFYWYVYNQDQVFHANDNAYADMLGFIRETQSTLDYVNEFVQTLLVEHDANLVDRLAIVQNALNSLTSDAKNYHDQNTAKANVDVVKGSCNSLESALEGIIADALAKEKAALSVELGLLKNDYDKATAEHIADPETMAIINEYKTIIANYTAENETIYSEYTVGKKDKDGKPIMKDGKPVCATADETHDAFVALEVKVAQAKKALTDFYDADANANAIASVEAGIADLQAIYDALVAQLADCHQPVVDEYQPQVEELKTAIDALQAELDQEKSDNSAILYNENNLKSIDNVKTTYGSLDEKITNMEKPYDANDAVYNAVMDQINQLRVNMQAAYDQCKDYEFKDSRLESDKNLILSYLDEEELHLNKRNAEGKGTGLKNGHDWRYYGAGEYQNFIDKYVREVSKYNADETINAARVNLEAAYDDYERKFYTVEDKLSLQNEYDQLEVSINWVSYFNYCVYNYGWYENNIYGQYVGSRNADYMTDEYQNIVDRANELRVAVEAFAGDVDLKSYIKGDIDHNRKINVADYSAVRNIVLGAVTVDPSESKFYAADVNFDNEVTVADMTAISSYIMNGEWPGAAQSKAGAFAVQNNDAISVATVTEGETQQIVISLNNDYEYVGAQMDIVLPVGMTIVGENLTSRANGHELFSNDINGAHRVVISDINNGEFFGNDGALLVLDVEVSAEYNGGDVTIENIIFTDEIARSYKLKPGVATGIQQSGITEKITETIYNIGGQVMNAVKSGINIIIGADGKSQKVIKK